MYTGFQVECTYKHVQESMFIESHFLFNLLIRLINLTGNVNPMDVILKQTDTNNLATKWAAYSKYNYDRSDKGPYETIADSQPTAAKWRNSIINIHRDNNFITENKIFFSSLYQKKFI